MDSPDPFLKMAKMTIRIIDGELRLFSGAPLPRLPENTIGDLIIPSHRLRDETLARWIQHEAEIELLPAGVTILAAVNPQNVPSAMKDKCVHWDNLKVTSKLTGRSFVAIELNEPLKLLLRGEKRPKLFDCKCTIPVLDLEAESLNHAFALITSTFEPERISRGGNVFNNLAAPDGAGHWELLDDVRKLYEDRLEERRHFALLFASLLAQAHVHQLPLFRDQLLDDRIDLVAYLRSQSQPLVEAFDLTHNQLLALKEVGIEKAVGPLNRLIAFGKVSPFSNDPGRIQPLAQQIAALLWILYELADKNEALAVESAAALIKWGWALLSEFQRLLYQPDEAAQLLEEYERLSPEQRVAVYEYAKNLAVGKIHLPK